MCESIFIPVLARVSAAPATPPPLCLRVQDDAQTQWRIRANRSQWSLGLNTGSMAQILAIFPMFLSNTGTLLSPQSETFYGEETGSWQEGTRRFGPLLHMWCSHRLHTLASPCAWRKLLDPSCFWRGQYSPLFLPSQEVKRGVLVTSCVLLVLKLAVTATVGPNRDFTKLSKAVGSGCDNKQTGFNPLFLYLPGPCHETIYVFIDVE